VLQKVRGRRPFPFGFIAACARQLLRGLELLRAEQIVHADIKPQNVVLRQPTQGSGGLDTIVLDEWTLVTLIDFGSCLSLATLDRCSSTGAISYVQSRWYRAPEVLLAAPCDSRLDVWSLGCVIAELALGCPLLPGESEYNQLRRTCRLCGPPPSHMLDRSKRAARFFVRCRSRGPSTGAEVFQQPRCGAGPQAWRSDEVDLLMVAAPHEPTLVHYLPDKPLAHLVADASLDVSEHKRQVLLELLQGMLVLEPTRRWSAATALRHCARWDQAVS